jgi:hypothetical protein
LNPSKTSSTIRIPDSPFSEITFKLMYSKSSIILPTFHQRLELALRAHDDELDLRAKELLPYKARLLEGWGLRGDGVSARGIHHCHQMELLI